MSNSIKSPVFTCLMFTLALTVPTGCGDDGKKKDEMEDGTGDEIGDEIADDDGEDRPEKVCKSSCQECADLMKEAYVCMASDEFDDPLADFDCIVCDNDGPGSASVTCETQANLQSIPYATMDSQLLACDNSMVAAKCIDWSPARQVHWVSVNQWEVERDFIVSLVADPSRLIGCDGARVNAFMGSYRVTTVDSDDLLGQLGFMDDDVIQSVNGYSMSGPFAAAEAFFELWPDTRVFTVSVLRPGVGTLTLTYNLV